MATGIFEKIISTLFGGHAEPAQQNQQLKRDFIDNILYGEKNDGKPILTVSTVDRCADEIVNHIAMTDGDASVWSDVDRDAFKNALTRVGTPGNNLARANLYNVLSNRYNDLPT